MIEPQIGLSSLLFSMPAQKKNEQTKTQEPNLQDGEEPHQFISASAQSPHRVRELGKTTLLSATCDMHESRPLGRKRGEYPLEGGERGGRKGEKGGKGRKGGGGRKREGGREGGGGAKGGAKSLPAGLAKERRATDGPNENQRIPQDSGALRYWSNSLGPMDTERYHQPQ